MTLSLAPQRRFVFVLLITLGLVALADWLFFKQPRGWSLGLYAAALTLALAVRDRGNLGRVPGRIVTAAAAGLAVALTLQVSTLNFILTVAAVTATALVSRGAWTRSVAVWAFNGASFAFLGWLRPIQDLRLLERWQRLHPSRTWRWAKRLLAWGVPLLLSLVFVWLFAVANPLIARWLDQARHWLTESLQKLPDLIAPKRVMFWVAVAVWCWALLRVRGRRGKLLRRLAPQSLPISDSMASLFQVGFVLRCLVVFNLVFAVQTTLDLYYLWLGHWLRGGVTLPAGITYADYAHRGAYPLVATALLAGGFVLATFGPGGAAQCSTWARRLVYVWIAQNVFLVASAAWRLNMYVQVYTLTRWRVAAMVWMLLVALGLAWLVWRIVAGRTNVWLLRVNAVTLLAVLYVCAFVPFDPLIAHYNVRHCQEVTGGQESPKIDLAYLSELGPDALPALHWLAQHRRTREGPSWAWQCQLMLNLQEQLCTQLADWRGWTIRRHLLAQQNLSILAAPPKPQSLDPSEYGSAQAPQHAYRSSPAPDPGPVPARPRPIVGSDP